MLLNRKDKWRNTFITDGNVDEYVQDLCNDTKGRYINQGVSFNKNDSFQMDILKQVFLSHESFSSLVKHLLHQHFKTDKSSTLVLSNTTNLKEKDVAAKNAIENNQKGIVRSTNLSAFTTPDD